MAFRIENFLCHLKTKGLLKSFGGIGKEENPQKGETFIVNKSIKLL